MTRCNVLATRRAAALELATKARALLVDGAQPMLARATQRYAMTVDRSHEAPAIDVVRQLGSELAQARLIRLEDHHVPGLVEKATHAAGGTLRQTFVTGRVGRVVIAVDGRSTSHALGNAYYARRRSQDRRWL
jgi:hypothetical protein